MLAVNDSGIRARWEVMWVAGKRVVRKNCGADLAEATRIYVLAKQGNRRAVTLRCCNMGFPPPEDLQPRTITFDKPKLLRGRKVSSVHITPMKKRNAAGIWWCPYCMQLRRFVKRSGAYVGTVWVPDETLCCPMCGVTHRDHHVRKWNPLAQTMEFRTSTRVSDPNRRAKQRQRRQQRRERDGDS